MRTYFVPGDSTPIDPGLRARIEELVGEDESTFSPRERKLAEYAIDHGFLYWATIESIGGGSVATSDMGDPYSTVRLYVPRGTTPRRLLEALDAAIQVLMGVD